MWILFLWQDQHQVWVSAIMLHCVIANLIATQGATHISIIEEYVFYLLVAVSNEINYIIINNIYICYNKHQLNKKHLPPKLYFHVWSIYIYQVCILLAKIKAGILLLQLYRLVETSATLYGSIAVIYFMFSVGALSLRILWPCKYLSVVLLLHALYRMFHSGYYEISFWFVKNIYIYISSMYTLWFWAEE